MKGIFSFLGGVVGWVATNLGILGFLPHTVQTAIAGVSAVLAALGIHLASNGSPIHLNLDKLGKGWKTITGAIVAVLGYLLSPDVFGSLGAGFAHILTLVGTVLAALGIYHTASKSVVKVVA